MIKGYGSYDISFCSFTGCKEENCSRHQKRLKDYPYPVSIMDFPRCENWKNGKWAIDDRFQKKIWCRGIIKIDERKKQMIKLTEEYYIDSDIFNWILAKKKKVEKGKTKGEVKYAPWKFFPSLESLLTFVKEMNCRAIARRCDDFDTYLSKVSAENKKMDYSVSHDVWGHKKEWVKWLTQKNS